MYLGFDTSNYTTSAAAVGAGTAQNVSRLLDVAPGMLGLRQSDALFQHVKRLPDILSQLMQQLPQEQIRAVAASTRPRAVDGSYMPCFLAGESLARSLSQALRVPFYGFSHQQGHIAAALWSADRMDLMKAPHLAWHLSGGTTELLLVEPDESCVSARVIGGTTDISAGQVIDRAGKLLGIPFPSGKDLDRLSRESSRRDHFSVKLQGLKFSLSGLENKIVQQHAAGLSQCDTAAYALHSVIDVICRATAAARTEYPGLEVVFSGGVSSNFLLRERCRVFSPVFAKPEFSTDNAAGIALLCSMQEGETYGTNHL